MLRHNVPQGRISLPVTGQRGKNHYNVVIPEGVPIVRASALSDYRSTINDAQLSGKREGMLVAVVDPLDGDKAGLYIATGSNDSDPWTQLSVIASAAADEFAVEEIDDAVDVETDQMFDMYFTLAETSEKIQTKVIQTPVRTLDGSYAYRCRLTTVFQANVKPDMTLPADMLFTLKLLNTTGGPDQHNIIDHAVFQPFVTTGLAFGSVETRTAATNNIPVRLHTAEGNKGIYTFSFVFEWTSTYDLLE